jgi:ankyrin repeat protein
VFRDQGQYDEALGWYNRALAGRENVPGENHPNTLDTIYNIAVIYSINKKYNRSLKFYNRILASREKFPAHNGHESIVKLLLDGRADVQDADKDGWTALHNASRNGHRLVVDLLLKHGADVQATTTTGCTALHAASQNRH